MAGSLASQVPIIPTPEEKTDAGHLLLLNESSTLISGITDAVTASHVPPTEHFPPIGVVAEKLPPPIGVVVEKLPSPIGVVAEKLPPPIGVVAEKIPHPGVGTEVVPPPNLNHTTNTMQQMDQMMERCNPDQV